MTDDPDVLTLNVGDSTDEFAKRLAERGLGQGFKQVWMPSGSTEYDHENYIPQAGNVPIAPDVFRRLASFVGRGTSGRAYIGGVSDVSSLVNAVAERANAALIRIDGSFADTSDLFGSPVVTEKNSFEWAAGTVPRAIQMTRDGPVVLHIENATGLDETVRDALLTLLCGTRDVTLRVGDQTVSTNLNNLSVLFSDSETPARYANTLASPVVFQRAFDASFDQTEASLYNPDAEESILVEDEGIPSEVAEGFVRVAAATRETEDVISLPFRALVKWAHLSTAYAEAGIDEPVYRAAENAVLFVYADDDEERDYLDKLVKCHVPPTFDGWG